MMKRLLTTTALGTLTSLPGIAAAQEIVDIGTLVISANQNPVEATKSGVTVETLNEEELNDNGTTQVVDQLRAVPGVFVTGSGPIGSAQSVFVRGRQVRYVPVYFDGIDLGDPSGFQTSFNWGGLVTAGLGRVEVLKGSQSAVYGSEAVGGVINLSSLRLAEPGQEVRFSAEYGSYDTFNTAVSYLQKTDRADLSLTFSHYRTDGFSSADENQVGPDAEADGYRGTSMILSGSYAATDFLTLGGTFFVQDEELDIDDGGGAFGDNPDRVTTSTRLGMRAFATYDTGSVAHTFAVAHTNIDRADPDSGPFSSKEFIGTRTELEYSGVVDLANATLSFGAAHSLEEADVDNVTNDFEISSIWIESQMALSANVDATLSARAEDHSEFGSALTGRAALAWRITDATILRASVGTGFRAPSLSELFSPSFGNPDLEAEESWSVDLSLEHGYANGANVKGTLFYSEVDNLIGFDSAFRAAQTDGVSVAQGLELSGAFPVNDSLRLTAAYTYTDSKSADGVQLVRVPRNAFHLGVEADLTPRLNLAVNIGHFADRTDFNASFAQVSVPDYTLVDATLTYNVTDTTDAYLRIENLTDEEYQTASGFGTSDRALYFGIRASF